MNLTLTAPTNMILDESETLAISQFIQGCRPLGIEHTEGGVIFFEAAEVDKDEEI